MRSHSNRPRKLIAQVMLTTFASGGTWLQIPTRRSHHSIYAPPKRLRPSTHLSKSFRSNRIFLPTRQKGIPKFFSTSRFLMVCGECPMYCAASSIVSSRFSCMLTHKKATAPLGWWLACPYCLGLACQFRPSYKPTIEVCLLPHQLNPISRQFSP